MALWLGNHQLDAYRYIMSRHRSEVNPMDDHLLDNDMSDGFEEMRRIIHGQEPAYVINGKLKGLSRMSLEDLYTVDRMLVKKLQLVDANVVAYANRLAADPRQSHKHAKPLADHIRRQTDVENELLYVRERITKLRAVEDAREALRTPLSLEPTTIEHLPEKSDA